MQFDTEIGTLTLGYAESKLRCEFGTFIVDKEPPKTLVKELDLYLLGNRIERFSIDTPYASPFFYKCWEACRSIPYGETISYQELATRAGSPKAMRAAGQSMRRNPIAILTPCHRVIAASGALHGYSGTTSLESQELGRKQFLLQLERATIQA